MGITGKAEKYIEVMMITAVTILALIVLVLMTVSGITLIKYGTW